ncbi:winged helix-turn-helix domain-containing protein [Bacteroides sp. ET71]|uniref:winged helix-turn-helix domain-containing protein n=1 Tax=Bacteroides sp. ET71 TaxID=2939421 RepID=UPI002013AD1E|nr:winged helix-turn-helix domain-containing protein [Bacteroides sp. ET71]MCL1615385.1 winged helix-turn-helix domain-containing protein [Bacteroides sp. ET71]
MKFNIQAIKTNSRKVYDILLRYTHCTFGELEKRCNLASTDLCMALLQLLREKKIEQVSENEGVYYRLAVAAA